MDNDKTLKRKSISLIAKNLILLLSVAVTGVIGAWSWFSNNTTATANGISVSCKAPDGLEIAVVEHGAEAPKVYTEGSVMLSSDEGGLLEDLYLSEVTGSGENDSFYKPKLTQSQGIAKPDDKTETPWDEARANVDYISFDLYMRSKSEQTVSIAKTTKIAPASTVLTWSDGYDASAYNPSTAGNFSRDCIVGAVRFSMVDSTSENTRKLLWIPAPNIFMNTTETPFTMETNKISGESFEHTYYTVDSNGAKKKNVLTSNNGVTVNSNVASGSADYTLGTTKEIVKLDNKKPNEEYYVDYVTCHLWIEGEDSEARLALTGGKFSLNLDLEI